MDGGPAHHMGQSDLVGGDTTRTRDAWKAPTSDVSVFSDGEVAVIPLASLDVPRYMLDCAGMRHPVDEYGIRVTKGVSAHQASPLKNGHACRSLKMGKLSGNKAPRDESSVAVTSASPVRMIPPTRSFGRPVRHQDYE